MKGIKLPVSIEANSEKEYKAVLKELEKLGYKWQSGRNATELCYFSSSKYIEVNTRGEIIYCISSEHRYHNRMTAAEFLGKGTGEVIVIYRNGAETVTLDKRTGKKGVAKCSPADEYDFTTGAKLAFERLTGEQKEPEKKPLYNGKVVCLDAGPNIGRYTKGKVYEFVDGTLTNNNGYKFTGFVSFEH